MSDILKPIAELAQEKLGTILTHLRVAAHSSLQIRFYRSRRVE
ncbi:MAG: hypothetical protein ACREV4_06075 [Gammaproteobacteria bacterium]